MAPLAIPKSSRNDTSSPDPRPAQPVQIPTIDIVFDPFIIPSLPPPGGSIGHNELMGRPAVLPSKSPSPDIERSPSDQDKPQRPGLVKRSSSFENHRPNANHAGVGAGRGHGRNWSTSSSEGLLQVPKEQPGRKFSANSCIGLSRTRGVSKGRGHGRTSSDSTAVAVSTRSTENLGQPESKSRSTSTSPGPVAPPEECLKLGSEADLPKISRLLITLQALIPPSRTPSPAPPHPSSAHLHPRTLITPLVIILEALVVERGTIKSADSSIPRLPILRDGSSFQIPDSDGELDWRITKAYILAVGTILNSLLPFLQSHSDQGAVGEVVKTVRVYVGKMKKVFGEIAGMYVDGYGFLKGWWDEGGMKSAAGEVGRWGDLFDA